MPIPRSRKSPNSWVPRRMRMPPLLHAAANFWHALQVEHRGQYSDDQLRRFAKYQGSASARRVAIVCVLTPIPMVIVLVLLGLIPLESVDHGALGSPNVWIRQSLTMVIMSLTVLQQIRQHLPEFQINACDCFLITIISSVCDVAFALAGASLIGYPMPFTMVLGNFPWYISFTAVFIARKYQILRDVSHSISRMGRYILMSWCQLALTVIYPLYGFTYKNLSATQQTGFVLVLPLIKIVTKNWISHALPDSDDAKPEAVIFNVEIFHSLFVSLCMGNTASMRTFVVLMAVDVLEAWIAFHDVLHACHRLVPICRKLDAIEGRDVRRYPSVSMIANMVAESGQTSPTIKPHPCWGAYTSVRGGKVVDVARMLNSDGLLRSARIVPEPSSEQSVQSLVDQVYGRFKAALTLPECEVAVNQTKRMLFVIEFIVLIEYTEVIIPTVYSTLMLALIESGCH